MKASLRDRIAAVVSAGLVILGTGMASGEPQKPKELARQYDKVLQGMMGEPFGKVLAAIEDWEFECLDAWEAKDPAPRDVVKHNRNKIKFSKKEIPAIFGGAGTYRVVIYDKLVGTDSTAIGEVNSAGRSAGKDLTLRLEKYTVIRAVFKDNVLILARVWPVMDQSGVSGGMRQNR
jgi:hypothetical protein